MQNDNEKPQDQHPNFPFNSLPPGSILDPETITDEQLAAVSFFLFPKMTAEHELLLVEFRTNANEALESGKPGGRDKLKTLKSQATGAETFLERWNERTSKTYRRLVELQECFGGLADGITDRLADIPADDTGETDSSD